MGEFSTGQAVRRREDVRFVTGAGRYTDDLNLDGQARIWFVRSPLPHARIVSINTDAAAAMPGVVAVFTGKDVAADPQVGSLPCMVDVDSRHGEMFKPPRPLLPADRVRFVGDLVALVVAETEDMARNAAEAIEIDYDDLPFVVDTADAVAPDAPPVWADCPGNVCVHWDNREPAEVAALFDGAPHIAEIELVNNRVIANPMEPRCALADYDADTGVSTLYCPTQGANRLHRIIAQQILRMPADKLRVVSPDVGGGFGVRSKSYPEIVLTVWASRRLGRPVKWLGDRAETMASDTHGRDNVTRARLALDAEGRALALRVETLANMGAYLMEFGPAIPTMVGQRSMGTVYAIPELYHSVRCVFTNTTPIDAYRGAGRPETVYVMERLMDTAAVELGLDPVEIRRRNLIPASAMPYRNTQDIVIDSGDFPGLLDETLAKADWSGFAGRRVESAAHGRLRGIGIALSLECSGGAPEEEARVRLEHDGGATVYVGTFSHGQGHETVFPQVAAERLGIPYDRVRLVHAGDTDAVPFGLGTTASRSAHMGGEAIVGACDRVIEAARQAAGRLLQTDPAALGFADGVFRAPDGGGSIAIADIAASGDGDATAPIFDETFRFKRDAAIFNYPNGCHIAEIEVDPDTGVVAVVRYTAVDDNGVILNPMIVHGQAHGAIVQGIGQALLEHTVYDRETGQLYTATFLDYAMPRAASSPALDVYNFVVPCTTNALGVKGAGEGGSCAAPPAIVGAVADALKHMGVRHIDMPLTPGRVWRAIREARET